MDGNKGMGFHQEHCMLNTVFIIEFVSITSVLGKTASANMEKLKLSRKIT